MTSTCEFSGAVPVATEELPRLHANDPELHPKDPRPAVVLSGGRLHVGDAGDLLGEVPVVEGGPVADHAGTHQVSGNDVGVLGPGAIGAGFERNDEVLPLLKALQPALLYQSCQGVPGRSALPEHVVPILRYEDLLPACCQGGKE